MFWESLIHGYSLILDYRIWVTALIYGLLTCCLTIPFISKMYDVNKSYFLKVYYQFITSLLKTLVITFILFLIFPLLFGGKALLGLVDLKSFAFFLISVLVLGTLQQLLIMFFISSPLISRNGTLNFFIIGIISIFMISSNHELCSKIVLSANILTVKDFEEISLLKFLPNFIVILFYLAIGLIIGILIGILADTLFNKYRKDRPDASGPLYRKGSKGDIFEIFIFQSLQGLAAILAIATVTSYTSLNLEKELKIRSNSNFYYNGALEEFNKTNYQDAIHLLNIGLKRQPADSLCLKLRALAKLNINNDTGAINDLNKLILFYPATVEFYVMKSIVGVSLNDIPGALKDINKAIEIEPFSAKNYCYRGAIKEKDADILGALIDFNKSIEINPNFAEAYLRRGVINVSFYESSKAIEDFSKAIDLNPKYADAYFCRGSLEIDLGNKKSGLNDIIKAANLGSKEAKEKLISIK